MEDEVTVDVTQDGPTVDDTIALELGAEEIENNNPIADLLSAIEDGEYNSAENQFNDLIGDRLQTALDQKKAEVAAQIYGDEEVEEVEAELEGEEEPENDELDDYEDQLIADEESEEVED